MACGILQLLQHRTLEPEELSLLLYRLSRRRHMLHLLFLWHQLKLSHRRLLLHLLNSSLRASYRPCSPLNTRLLSLEPHWPPLSRW